MRLTKVPWTELQRLRRLSFKKSIVAVCKGPNFGCISRVGVVRSEVAVRSLFPTLLLCRFQPFWLQRSCTGAAFQLHWPGDASSAAVISDVNKQQSEEQQITEPAQQFFWYQRSNFNTSTAPHLKKSKTLLTSVAQTLPLLEVNYKSLATFAQLRIFNKFKLHHDYMQLFWNFHCYNSRFKKTPNLWPAAQNRNNINRQRICQQHLKQGINSELNVKKYPRSRAVVNITILQYLLSQLFFMFVVTINYLF